MLAFALWDGRDRLVLLARDPFGIKPLYYAADQGQFRFASQVKALLSGGVDGQISPAGVVSFLTWGLRDRAPHLVSINQSCPCWLNRGTPCGRAATASYHDPLQALRGDVPPTASGRSLRNAVLDSVYHHLLADVPVGRLNDFGALLHEAWMNKKKMATQISDSHIDELYETARKHGAVGGKISGAGGGGYMFFYCNSNRKHILAEQMERMGARWWTLVSTFGDCRRGTRNKQPRHGSCRRDHSRRYPRKHRGQE